MPSTTKNTPRLASMCHASSLLRRTRPGSLAPAHLNFVLTIACASKLKEHHIGQPDEGNFRNGRLHVSIPLFAVHDFDTRGHSFSVDGCAESAQVLEKKLTAGRIASQAKMLARDVGQGIQFQVGPIVLASAADNDLVFRHPIRLAAAIVFVLDAGAGPGFSSRREWSRPITLRDRLTTAQASSGDALSHRSGSEFRSRRQCEFRMDHDVARLDIVVCVLKDADLPVSIRRNHFGTAPLSNFQSFGNRRTIHRHQFLVERTPRLLEDPCNYGPQPIQIVTVQIYIVDGWGQGGILQWL